MGGNGKRARSGDADSRSAKKHKGSQHWKKPRVGANAGQSASRATIDSGDAGVLITCVMGKEQKCRHEILDLFSQFVEGSEEKPTKAADDSDEEPDDIEAQINREVNGMKPSAQNTPKQFQGVRLDIQCLCFIKVDKSIDPVDLVHRICLDAQANPELKRGGRFVKRLTPVTEVRKTLSDGIDEMIAEVLKPHFHSGGPPRKFAIRPTIRNNKEWKRDVIIKKVAATVGPGHSVDLKNYDLMILVDVFQNVFGTSVVGKDYDQLKRYNLAELYDPTPQEVSKDEMGAADVTNVSKDDKEAAKDEKAARNDETEAVENVKPDAKDEEAAQDENKKETSSKPE